MKILKTLFKKLPKKSRVSYMNAKQLKELADKGFEIGSHGMTHSLFTANYMNQHKALYEMQKSKQWLEEITGKPVITFSFPAGRYNNDMLTIAKQVGYTSTCLVVRNKNHTEILSSYERIFIKPNSLDELKAKLKI
jgi:peptidoglycan/xylan/chitin deacetylase (PgdA/CDA1 family)